MSTTPALSERLAAWRYAWQTTNPPEAGVVDGVTRWLVVTRAGVLPMTLISGVVLAQYGTGPIKGFAVTLIIGVTCSIFTGVVVSRVLFDLWVRALQKRVRFSMG